MSSAPPRRPSLLRRMCHGLGTASRRHGTRAFVLLGLLAGLLVSANLLQLEHPVGGLQDSLYDRLIRWRLASPSASPRLLIVDIDEAALDQVGHEHGRWPWPRDVLAEALAAIAEGGAQAVFVNVLFTDPDPQRPEGDDALQAVAQAYPQLVFPLLRLPAANDPLSELDVRQLPGVRALGDSPSDTADPVAVVLPPFAALQQRMGASNLEPDADGILRRYPYWLATRDHALPSAAAATLLAAGLTPPAPDEPQRRLNWRNRDGGYARLSFATVYDAARGRATLPPELFKDRIVIVGANATGLSVLRPSSQAALTDDNLILATAIDDALQDTGLRLLPRQVILMTSLALLALLMAAFIAGVDQKLLDRSFLVTQVGLLAVIYLGISFTTWHLDLLLPVNAALACFAVARGLQAIRAAALEGHGWFWDDAGLQRARRVLVLRRPAGVPARRLHALRKRLEAALEPDQLLQYDPLALPGGLLGQGLSGCGVLLVLLEDGGLAAEDQAACEALVAQGVSCVEVSFEAPGLQGLQARREALWRAVVAG